MQRYQCARCKRSFSSQTFRTTYWLKRPDLLRPVLGRIVACSAYRQIARESGVSPTTIQRHVERLGRHCLLYQERLRPSGPPSEPLVLDGFVSFASSQYLVHEIHTLLGAWSHFAYGFTDSERRRSGRMRPAQRRRRAELERRFGRPDPRSVEKAVAALVEQVVPHRARAILYSDDHPAYPRAFHRLVKRDLSHSVTSARAARTPDNPLFPVNLFHGLVRHSSANHKRETLAFAKRHQHSLWRLAIFQVWRNTMKSFSERRRDATPAQRLGLLDRKLEPTDLLARRLFPSQIRLPARQARYYRGEVPTRTRPGVRFHSLRYAF